MTAVRGPNRRPVPPTFKGDRGVYRPLRMKDADALYVAHADPAVHRYWASPAHTSLEDSRAYTARTLEMSPYHWALTQDGAKRSGASRCSGSAPASPKSA
jgi:RimJ/RimL family protein N-acetyltransferase